MILHARFIGTRVFITAIGIHQAIQTKVEAFHTNLAGATIFASKAGSGRARIGESAE